MDSVTAPHSEHSIARSRLVLSLAALAAVFVDPTAPLVSHWIPLSSGRFMIDPYVLAVMVAHLLYSCTVYLGISRHWFGDARMAEMTTWTDVLFGAAIGFMTEGISSPFYAFFVFAVVVVGFRAGLRKAMFVTFASVGLYFGLIVVSAPGNKNLYIMRPVYLAITGYLVGYLGQQRLDLQEEVRQLEAAEQRHRIARDLHDGFAQALAGINLRIEGCRKMLLKQQGSEALSDLTDLQASINREYDELRTYMRMLAGMAAAPVGSGTSGATRLTVTATLSGSIDLVDHVLLIAREGISNIRRHARAAAGTISVGTEDTQVQIHIEDDGVGFDNAIAPWSIASRVRELGGQVEVVPGHGSGARLFICLPQA